VSTAVEFDPFSDDYFNDPTEVYRRLRDEAPVYYSERYGFYALSRYFPAATRWVVDVQVPMYRRINSYLGSNCHSLLCTFYGKSLLGKVRLPL